MRWQYGLIALIGIVVGWSIPYLWRQWAPVKAEPSFISLGSIDVPSAAKVRMRVAFAMNDALRTKVKGQWERV